ncbi:MAG: oligosaccharide flippase family protein [Patescibacteria group bacterium]
MLINKIKYYKKKIYLLLRWSEKYTKTDMIYLTKGGIWLILGYAIEILSGLIMVIAFANLLPKEAYGTYQFIIGWAAILSSFTLSGMGIAIMRATAQGSENALPYGLRMKIKWSLGIVIAGGLFAIYYYLNNNLTLTYAFLIVGTLAPFIEGFSLYKSYLIGKQFFRESALFGLYRKPIPIIAILSGLYFTNNPVIIIFLYFSSNAISIGLLYKLVIKKYNLKSTPDLKLFNYSKHLSVMEFISRIALNIDKLILFHLIGAAPVAIYVLATTPYIHLQKLFGLVGHLVFPKFTKQNISTLQKNLSLKTFLFFITTLITVILYIVAAPFLFRILFPAYPEAVIYSQVAILALLVKPRILYNQVFAAHAMKRAQYFIKISTAIVKIILLVILVPLYGIWGAINSLLLMHLYGAIIASIFFYTKK